MAYTPLQLAPKYIRYLFTASNGKGHGIHSPFVFDLVTKVLSDKGFIAGYEPMEGLRSDLLQNHEIISIEDLGAGPGKPAQHQRKMGDIAKRALKPPKFGQLFYRMARYYRPSTIIELGASLGITTAYLASGNERAKVITLEGAPAIAAIARRNFERLGLDQRIRLVEGNFDNTLGPLLATLPSLDLAYIDGNHRLEPTLRYYRQMQPLLHADSILIFDDIHWSLEMESAWETLCKDPRVTCSVDLFYIGILFFRTEFKVPQHFTIRF